MICSPVGAAEQHECGLEVLESHQQPGRFEVHVLSLAGRVKTRHNSCAHIWRHISTLGSLHRPPISFSGICSVSMLGTLGDRVTWQRVLRRARRLELGHGIGRGHVSSLNMVAARIHRALHRVSSGQSAQITRNKIARCSLPATRARNSRTL